MTVIIAPDDKWRAVQLVRRDALVIPQSVADAIREGEIETKVTREEE